VLDNGGRTESVAPLRVGGNIEDQYMRLCSCKKKTKDPSMSEHLTNVVGNDDGTWWGCLADEANENGHLIRIGNLL